MRRAVRYCAAWPAVLAAACAAPPGPIFPASSPPIVWPRPPDPPRIRYLGQLTGQADLRRKRGGWAGLRAALAGPAPTVSFSTPVAVAVAGERVYVADSQLGLVHVLDLARRTFAVIAQAAGARLQSPIDVALAGGRVVVADSRRAAVFLFDAEGTYLRTVGQGVLRRPAGLSWNPAAAELWVVDAAAHECLVFDDHGLIRTRIGGRGAGPGQFNYPAGLSYRVEFGAAVADAMNFRVQLFDADGTLRGAFGQKGDAAGDFALPRDVAFDSDGHLYVLDNQFENVQVFDRGGRLLLAFGQEGRGPGEFYLPSGITIDRRDRIWVADTYNRRVQVFQYLKQGAAPRPGGAPAEGG